ncbi:hypothetical protein LCGC14_1100290 [marine sediment metagenome]|uniref:HTH marR-type domain-containing protein n=1 Tax=marine sediment metagenome TaxID=412755 RepID=A0A0F9MXH9_9ZZZZ
MIVENKYVVPTYERKANLISLSPSSKFLLYVLKQSGPLKQKEIIRKTLLSKRTISYCLKRLQEENFIKKYSDPKDKRIKVYEILI